MSLAAAPVAAAPSDAVTDPASRRAYGSAFIVVLLAGVVLRLVNIGSQSYWGDEEATVRLMRQNLWHMFRYGIVGTETTPPLYYVLAAFWARVFGTDEFALRSFSAVVGAATIAVAFAIGIELRSRRAGLIAAAFVSLSPLMVWYSQDARAYSLLILLTSVALLFFAQALRTEASHSLWLWALASALALTAHYYAIFVVVPEALALLSIRRIRPRAAWPTASVAAVWIALLPLFLDQRSKTDHTSWITFIGLKDRLEMALQWFLTGRWTLNFPLVAAGGLCVAIIFAIGLATRRLRERELVILAVGVSGILLPIVAALFGLDYVYDRYLVATWMPFAVVLAAMLAAWKRVGVLVAVALCGASLAASVKVATTSSLQRSDWRLAAQELSLLPSDSLFLVYPDFEIAALQAYSPQVSVISSPWLSSQTLATARTVRTRRIVILAEHPWSSTAAHTLAFRVPAAFHETGTVSFSTFVLISYSARHALVLPVARLASMRPSGYLVGSTPWGTSLFREPPVTIPRAPPN